MAEVVSIVADAPLVETSSAALSRTVGPERGVEPSPGQPRPLLAPEPHRRRDQQRQLELPGRPRAAHDHQRLRPRPDRHRRLPARRGQQHRRPARHRQPRAQSRGRPGVPGHHEQLRRGVRPLPGGHRGRGHQVGNEPVPRRRVRVLPEREAERQALGPARDHVREGPARPEPVRGRLRRADPEGQDLLLRELLGVAAGGDLLPEHRRGAHAAGAGR